MKFKEISEKLGVSKQAVSQTASRGIKKLFKNAKSTYNLSNLETLEMLLVGLDIYKDENLTNYFMKNLSKDDLMNIEKERKLCMR